MDITVIVFGFVVWALSVLTLYFVVRYAVLHALRQHTISSTTGVSVVSSNPIPVHVIDASTDA